MNASNFVSVILAAGKGTRMKSTRPKVLHPVAGMSMLGHVLRAVEQAGAGETVLVTSPEQEEVRQAAARLVPGVRHAVQTEQLGTGDAVKAARDEISAQGVPVVVLCGDTPLLKSKTIANLVDSATGGGALSVLGFRAGNPEGYGRLLTGDMGELLAIREHKDASAGERAVNLCNSGVIAFASVASLALLDRISNDNAKGEYYLTDVVEIARAGGDQCAYMECAEDEVIGVNSRSQLARAEALMQHRLRLAAMDAGVTLISPETVYLSSDTEIAEDVTIEPHVFIGPGVSIAANAVIHAFSHLEDAHIAENASIGPYARLRPGARIGAGARIGNFVEVKNAEIATGAKVNHLAYVGDARVGQGANVGAGTITCNYDGQAKHFTDIGDGAFVGSNSSLVAPVSIGAGAYVGSGSVISKDVAADALAVTRARQTEIGGWAARKRKQRNDNNKTTESGGRKAASGG